MNIFYTPENLLSIWIVALHPLLWVLTFVIVWKLYSKRIFYQYKEVPVVISFFLFFIFSLFYFKYSTSAYFLDSIFLALITLLVAFPVVVESFVSLFWLYEFDKEKNGYWIVWTYRKGREYFKKYYLPTTSFFFLLFILSQTKIVNMDQYQWIPIAGVLYFGAFSAATMYSLVVGKNMLKFCEIGLKSMKKELRKTAHGMRKLVGHTNILLNFPPILDVFNSFLGTSELLGNPQISEKYRYDCYKALIVRVSETKGRLDTSAKNGFKLMIDALKLPIKPTLFHDFLKGLNYITQDNKAYYEKFDAPFGVINWIKRNRASLQLSIAIGGILLTMILAIFFKIFNP